MIRLRTSFAVNTKSRFLVYGSWNTIFGVALFAFAYSHLSDVFSYYSILIVTSFFSIVQAFFVQSKYVFEDEQLNFSKLGKFFALNCILVIANLFLMKLSVELFHMDPRVSQALIVGLIAVCSYSSQSTFIFRRT